MFGTAIQRVYHGGWRPWLRFLVHLGEMVLIMIPAMIAVMLYRRSEYAHSGPHQPALSVEEKPELAG